MRLRTPFARALVLGGALWVQCILVGPGVHDPGCAHHRPGSSGGTHVHGAAEALGATPPPGHAHHGAANPAAAPHGADPGTGGTPTDDDGCTCLGICVPGALVGITLPGAGVDVAPAPARSVGGSIAGPVPAVLPAPPTLLPPSTGPPRGA
ncbi:MAG: hypothetical protein AMXMBFR53_13330 [Gemmatimonadota bacterium]